MTHVPLDTHVGTRRKYHPCFLLFCLKLVAEFQANNVHKTIGSLNRRILFFVRRYALYNLFVGLQLGNIGQIMTDI